MLFKTSLALLTVWLLGVVGVYNVGDAAHARRLMGLLLLMVAFLRAREAAVRRAAGGSGDRT